VRDCPRVRGAKAGTRYLPRGANIPARKQDEKTGKRMKPIDMAKRKRDVHKKKCIGCQDVNIHALTPMDADVANSSELPVESKPKELTVQYHVEKHISDKDLRGTLLLFRKGEKFDALELMVHDATDRRLAAENNFVLPPNRQGEESLRPPCMTWTTIVICGCHGYDGSWVTKEWRKDFKNAMLKRLRSKQVESGLL
jgi:hypothetical protein